MSLFSLLSTFFVVVDVVVVASVFSMLASRVRAHERVTGAG